MKRKQKEKRTTRALRKRLHTILRTLLDPFKPISDVPRGRHRLAGFSWFLWSMLPIYTRWFPLWIGIQKDRMMPMKVLEKEWKKPLYSLRYWSQQLVHYPHRGNDVFVGLRIHALPSFLLPFKSASRTVCCCCGRETVYSQLCGCRWVYSEEGRSVSVYGNG